ncbi:hypothetical protein [Calothrix sp. NIES-2100]|uniref:hypothetical protein n=1 Tax=Calothrix sp. NIES-2100 TaxID=1954172 RepID=UPI0030DB3D2B
MRELKVKTDTSINFLSLENSMGFNIIGAVIGFVIPAAERIVSAFIDHKFSKEDKRNLPVKVQEIRQDQRIRLNFGI